MFRLETTQQTLPYNYVLVSAKKELAPGSKTTLASPEFTWASQGQHLRVSFSEFIPTVIKEYIFHPVSEDATWNIFGFSQIDEAETSARSNSKDSKEIRIYKIESSNVIETFNRQIFSAKKKSGEQVTVSIHEIEIGELIGTY